MTHPKQLFVVFFLFILSSCSFHSGGISTSTIPPNSTYEDIAVGVSQANRVLGYGGTGRDALVLEAKRQLYSNRPLAKNEMYVNFTVDIKSTYIIVYHQVKVTVTADVIQVHSEAPDSLYSKNYLKKIEEGVLATDLFHVGDTVVNRRQKEMVILGVEKPKKVRVLYETRKGKWKSRRKSIKRIYTDKSAYNGITPGDQIDEEDAQGTVRYVGLRRFFYQDENGVFWSSYYQK